MHLKIQGLPSSRLYLTQTYPFLPGFLAFFFVGAVENRRASCSVVFSGVNLNITKKTSDQKRGLESPEFVVFTLSIFFLFRIWVHDPIIFGCGIQIGFHELRTIRLLAANGLQGLPGFCSFQRLKNDFPTEQPVEQESKRTEFFSSNKSQNI